VPMLLVSGGDTYGGKDAYNRPKCQFIARMMSRLGYDAVALGETDLAFGLDAIVEDVRDSDLKMVCANVFRKTTSAEASEARGNGTETEPVFSPYRIVEKNGIRFGVLSVLSPAAKNAKVAAEAGEIEALTYVIRSPLPVLEKLVPLVKQRSDFVVLLAHMSKVELDSVLAAVEGVDMVVLGHSAKPQVTAQPTEVQGVPVYMASHQGQYLGRAMLTFDEDRRLQEATNEIRLLDNTVGDDPDMTRLVREFEVENRRQQKELFVKEELRRSGPGDIYVGVATCRRCHAGAFDAYTRTKHAHAYATISSVFMHRDSGCLPCHSTGYGANGGFSGVRARGSLVDLVDVQCEACHGPARDHSRDGRYLETARNSCAGCHTAEQDPEFDYAAEWEKIEH
jgi:2',3'-cyclic-nucleotide 2'-phosphodiesterase (5'-nucleotidase family)